MNEMYFQVFVVDQGEDLAPSTFKTAEKVRQVLGNYKAGNEAGEDGPMQVDVYQVIDGTQHHVGGLRYTERSPFDGDWVIDFAPMKS